MSQPSRSQFAGRTYFDDLESAMRYYRVPVKAQATVRQTLAAIAYDQLWVPPSKTYIAVAHAGEVMAWVHKGHIGIPGSANVELPGFRERSRGPRTAHAQRKAQLCPVHHLELAATGVCPSSED